ncbi:MAG TPA: hypothetical protein VGP93_04880 [Polyangiaceae bacterium]|nr:hypothetical protein [Polyangiaceae bacterium]
MSKLRVLYVLRQYPQASQTYIENELRELGPECEPIIAAMGDPDAPYREHLPFQKLTGPQLAELVARTKPDVLHTHWMLMVPFLGALSKQFGIPFTVRSHSFESMVPEGSALPPFLAQAKPYVQSALCLKVFCMPFTHSSLARAGVPEQKLEEYYPIVNVSRFSDRTPNGEDVMNIGACAPKKKMEDFVDLAVKLRGKRNFTLYALPGPANELAVVDAYNKRQGSPVRVSPTVEPEQMLGEYKRHGWLVYTACPRINQVGWPLSIGEAMAAGVGVCMPLIRPDIRDFIGDAGYIYEDIREVSELVLQPPAADMRERGFERAKVFDVKKSVAALLATWRKAVAASA